MPKILDNPKESILFYAKKIVLNEGIEKLTIREVSKKSGIAVGTIYNYFPSKKDLLIELIENYWYEYLIIVDEIDKMYEDLFIKLQEIFTQMVLFVNTFKEVWIKNYSSEYTDDEISRENIFLDKLIKKLESILTNEQKKETIHLSINPYIISKFLVLNYMTMAQMNQFKYSDFDKIIKDYFSI